MRFAVVLLITLKVLTHCFPAYAGEQCGTLLEKSWRGIDCFHCMYPTAQGGSSPVNDLLTGSCLKKVMIAYVMDGSFGYNAEQVVKSIDSLTAGGRELWIHFYVYNGPAQRRWQSGIFKSFAIMDPFVFQRRLLHEKKLQDDYSRIVK